MPKKITNDVFEELIKAVARFPGGATIQELVDSMENAPARRTLQRYMAILTSRNKLTRKGDGPGSRYSAPVTNPDNKADAVDSKIMPSVIQLSSKALDIRSKVSASLNRRTPVGYNRAFLDDYHPNSTYYLPPDIRADLLQLGSMTKTAEPAGTYLREIFNRLLIDLSWNSSRLEGNTYSLLDTQQLIELGESAEGKDSKEAQMILNHKGAIEMLCEQASDIGINRYTILNLHALLSDNLLPDPLACGRLRSKGVGITGTVFHPLESPQVLEECFDIILQKANAIKDAFEQAFFVMVHIPYLQPFEDVNKRVSRLAANIPLTRMNLCPLSFVDVPEQDYTRGMLGIYELNAVEYLRDVFVWAYKRSCARYSAVRQSLGEPDPFRLKHRELIKDIVRKVLIGRVSRKQASRFIINAIPSNFPADDHQKLQEIIEIELSSLHDGNFARYRLKPSEYKSWRNNWQTEVDHQDPVS